MKKTRIQKIYIYIHDKYIFQYKSDIDDIAKYVCYCQKLCFKHQVYYASQSYNECFPNVIKNVKSNDHVLMCKSCTKKKDFGKLLNLVLREHIVNNKPNMEIFLQFKKLNNI